MLNGHEKPFQKVPKVIDMESKVHYTIRSIILYPTFINELLFCLRHTKDV